jgi:hypothetical protein
MTVASAIMEYTIEYCTACLSSLPSGKFTVEYVMEYHVADSPKGHQHVVAALFHIWFLLFSFQ